MTKVEKIDANQVILNLEGKLIALKLSDLQFLSAVRSEVEARKLRKGPVSYRKKTACRSNKNKGKSGEITLAGSKDMSRR